MSPADIAPAAAKPDCSIYLQEDGWLVEIAAGKDGETTPRKRYRTFASLDAAARFAREHQLTYCVYARPLWVCRWPMPRRF